MRALSLPSFLVALTVAIVFFKVYGILTRPDVPRPIAIVVGQFAPGVELGSSVYDVRHSVAGMRYVPHLGFVGIPGARESNLPGYGRVPFTQVRLLVGERARLKRDLDPRKARIEAVEVVSVMESAPRDIGNALFMLFQKPPQLGCLTPATENGSPRSVQLWMTRNERGGVALITGAENEGSSRYPGLMITSVVAFTGKFAGGRTLRGNYSESSCEALLERK